MLQIAVQRKIWTPKWIKRIASCLYIHLYLKNLYSASTTSQRFWNTANRQVANISWAILYLWLSSFPQLLFLGAVEISRLRTITSSNLKRKTVFETDNPIPKKAAGVYKKANSHSSPLSYKLIWNTSINSWCTVTPQNHPVD